jgi:hypothetical protein
VATFDAVGKLKLTLRLSLILLDDRYPLDIATAFIRHWKDYRRRVAWENQDQIKCCNLNFHYPSLQLEYGSTKDKVVYGRSAPAALQRPQKGLADKISPAFTKAPCRIGNAKLARSSKRQMLAAHNLSDAARPTA